jgi:citrate synthase
MKGIIFRGHSIPDFQKLSQKAKNGFEPLPEVMWWLLVTGRFPTDAEFN